MEKVVEIREAVRDDCQAIRKLIQELADFEEMPDGPKIDYKVLEKDGFDTEHPLFKCYVAVYNGKLVGYALYFYMYFTLNQKAIHMEDLYVTPEFRKKHVGSRLFDTVAKKTFAENCSCLNFAVLSWNPAQEFYKAKGAVDLSEIEGWHMFRLNQKYLQNLAPTHPNDVYEIRDAQLDDFYSITRLAEEASDLQKNRSEVNLNKPQAAVQEPEFNICHPDYQYIVVSLNHKVVGYALYCYAYSTWEGKSMFLQEFYVSPNDYKTNMKNDLLFAIAKKAFDENCSRIDFWIYDSKNDGQFYHSNGAVDLTETEEWHLYRLFQLKKKTSS